MDTINNNPTLRNLAVGLFAILIAFVALKSIAEVKSLPYIGKSAQVPNTITVNGKGEILVTPDVAKFNFTVSEEAPVVSEAQSKATKKMNDILAYLEKSGIDEKDVETISYDIYPRYDYTNGTYYASGKQVLAAYVVSQTIAIKVKELEKAGDILSGIGEYGASNVSGLTFSVDEQDEIVRQARDKAIADAKEQAQKLAKSLGVTLDSISSFYDSSPYQPYPVYYGKDMAVAQNGMGMGGGGPSIPTGESKIISNVTITYLIK